MFRKITKPRQIAESMFDLFELVVKDTHWQNQSQLRDSLVRLCGMLISKDKMNFVVRNCSERMLRLLNQACKNLKLHLDSQTEISSLTSLRQLKRIERTTDEEMKADMFDAQEQGRINRSATVIVKEAVP